MALRGHDTVVVVMSVVAANHRIVTDGAVRRDADIFGVFARRVSNGMADFAERVAVVPCHCTGRGKQGGHQRKSGNA